MDFRDIISRLRLIAALGAFCVLMGAPGECPAIPPVSGSPASPPPAPAAPAAMDNETASALTPLAIERYIYESSGRRDPFMPLVDKKLPASAPAKVNKPPRALSPLEEPDLKSIALKGIVMDAKNKYAVVEIKGKTYVITEKTYLGNEGGRVVKINNDRLIVEVVKYDELGKEIKSLQSIQLRKEDQE
ncbi:MAG: pilus assembly protein PilP [Nitrospirae bacterium]|nr:pilus assembly protein PilP [Nitrospirota bacterium]